MNQPFYAGTKLKRHGHCKKALPTPQNRRRGYNRKQDFSKLFRKIRISGQKEGKMKQKSMFERFFPYFVSSMVHFINQ